MYLFKLRLTDLQIKFMLTRTVICVSAKADRDWISTHTQRATGRWLKKDLLYTLVETRGPQVVLDMG